MRTYIGIFVLFTTVGLTSVPSHGQDLADLARKERARRATVKRSGRVFTNADLVKYEQPSEDGKPIGEFKPPQSLERVASGTQANRSEAEEECAWSQRFLAANRQLLEAEIPQRRLQARIRELNFRAAVSENLGPYDTSQETLELAKTNQKISVLKENLENLREQLRKSGQPQSWEGSLAALMGCSESGELDGPETGDQQYWEKQVAMIDSYYDSLVSPLEAEISGHRDPGNPYVPDITLLIKELRQRHQEEERAVAELAVRKGALPGWFR